MFGRKRKAVTAPAGAALDPRHALRATGPSSPGRSATTPTASRGPRSSRRGATRPQGTSATRWSGGSGSSPCPALEARHYVQAWTFLRQYGGVQPPGRRRPSGCSAWWSRWTAGRRASTCSPPTPSARPASTPGRAAGSCGSGPTDRLDGHIGALLDASKAVLDRIGPWTQPRLPPPPPDHIRLNFLAPSGLHFGQAPFAMFEQDALAGPVVRAATAAAAGDDRGEPAVNPATEVARTVVDELVALRGHRRGAVPRARATRRSRSRCTPRTPPGACGCTSASTSARPGSWRSGWRWRRGGRCRWPRPRARPRRTCSRPCWRRRTQACRCWRSPRTGRPSWSARGRARPWRRSGCSARRCGSRPPSGARRRRRGRPSGGRWRPPSGSRPARCTSTCRSASR